MAHWESQRISDVIARIERRSLVLPVVQRNFVWSEEKIELLFDTLLKGNSFGGIMTIGDLRGRNPLFRYRPFIKDHKDGVVFSSKHGDSKLADDLSYVVDGQQRLSAFYIGLCGSYNDKRLYLNLLSPIQSGEFDFQFALSKEKLVLEPDQPSAWVSVQKLFDELQNINNVYELEDRYVAEYGIQSREEARLIEKVLRRFNEEVRTNNNIGFCRVSLDNSKSEDENREHVVELFRRLNQGGTKLDALELVASKLKGFDADNEAFLENIKNQFKDIGFGQDEVLKFIFILQDAPRKGLHEIGVSDSNFIKQHKNDIENALTYVREFLVCFGLYEFFKSSNVSVIPLYILGYSFFYQSNLKGDVEKGEASTELHRAFRWIVLSMLQKVFRRKGSGWIAYSTGVRKLSEKISQHKSSPSFPVKELFDVYKNHPLPSFRDQIHFDERSLNEYDRDFLVFLLYDKPSNFRVNDIDHIHPCSKLNSEGFPFESINSVLNYQWINFSVNRGEKSNKQLSDWLNNKEFDEGGLRNYLATHLIPDEQHLWNTSQFEEFREARRNLIELKLRSKGIF